MEIKTSQKIENYKSNFVALFILFFEILEVVSIVCYANN